MDAGPGAARDALARLFQQRDEGGAAGLALGKFHGRLHFGQHGPGGKLSVRHILAGCLGRQLIQPLNIRFAKMDGNLLHGREDNQAVGIQLAGQTSGGKIFVNDRRSALQMEPLGAEHRDAPAAAGDDHQAGVHHILNGLDFHDGLRAGEATTRRYPRPASSTTV